MEFDAAFGTGYVAMNLHLRSNYPTREIGRQIDTEAIKRHAFNNQGIVVVKLDDPRLSWDQREIVKQVGQKLYGRPA